MRQSLLGLRISICSLAGIGALAGGCAQFDEFFAGVSGTGCGRSRTPDEAGSTRTARAE